MLERLRPTKPLPRLRPADKGPCEPATLHELNQATNARPDRVVIKADAWYDLCRCQAVHKGPLLDASVASAGGFPCKFLTADREALEQALAQHKKVCPHANV